MSDTLKNVIEHIIMRLILADGLSRFSNILTTALLFFCKQNATEVLKELLALDFQ